MTAALDAARSGRLLSRHVPTLAYHKQEPYWACSPAVMTDSFVEGRYSNYLQNKNGVVIAQSGPSLARPRLDLAFLNGAKYGADGPRPSAADYLNAHAGTYAEDAARLQADPAYGDKVYGRYVQARGGRVWLQYWLFYYYNDKSLAGIGLHEGDWEMVQIGLGDDGKPEVATYAQHNDAEHRDWGEVRKVEGPDGRSPLVYVGLGSHASYFDPGEYRIKIFPTLDHATGKGRRVKPKLVELSEAEPWLAWPGRWGRMGLSDTSSPPGPMQHKTQWTQPDAFHAAARGKRHKLGPIYFALGADARVPPPAITAVRTGDQVAISYDFRSARGKAERPARLLLSVNSSHELEAPSTHSFVIASERGRVIHPARIGEGDYEVDATAMTVADAASETVTVKVGDEPLEAGADREGFFLRLLVETPDGFKGGAAAIRRAANEALGVDADGRRWAVDHLFPAPPDGRRPKALRRHFQVTGRAIATPTYPPQQQAFDIAHRLRDQLGGADVQPDLPSDAFAAPPERRGAARATAPAPRQKDWSLTAVRAQKAWDLEPTRGAGIVVGHPDTGYTVHKELEAGSLDLARAWNVIDDNADARDPLRKPWWSPLASPGHGTGTASAIVGRIAGQVSGTAPGATLVPLRTVKSVVQVFDGDVGLAIERARQQGCHVVSMSLGGVGFSGAVRDAISAAVDSGMIVMAAAGNYVHFVTAPASWPECLAIGATNVDSKPWSGSSRGPEVDFCAPGEAVWAATAWRDGHAVKDEVTPHYGTSFAVATTAGVAALWLGLHGVDALRERYGPGNLQRLFLTLARSTAREPADWDRRSYGAGILDARALLEAQLPDPATFARAAAGGGPRKPPDALDRLATLWPDLSRSQVKSGLATALGKRGKALDELLERFGGELFYRYSQDASLRSAVGGRQGAAVAAAARAERARSGASAALTSALER